MAIAYKGCIYLIGGVKLFISNDLCGKEKRFRDPLRYTFQKAVGALTLHTGQNRIIYGK